MSSYDFVVIGAGMFGASFARLATDVGKTVLVIEKRPHVGGNCYSEVVGGIHFQKYGPHVFHTSSERVWNFVNRFSRWRPYVTRTKVSFGTRLFSFPINLMTLHQLWGVCTPNEAMKRLEREKVRDADPRTIEGWALANLGREIYETFIEGYTWKQWGRDPRTLPASIVKRLPIRTRCEDDYFSDRYQAIPEEGYATFFEHLLSGIEVRLNTDYFQERGLFERLGKIVYSGRIDEFFDYRFGRLDFRSCEFRTESLPGDFQGNAVVNYTARDVAYTRIIEHKHFWQDVSNCTLVTREYPVEAGTDHIPLYPINDARNTELYRHYAALRTDSIIAGRLGRYQYLDMHHVISQAMALVEQYVG